MMNMTLIQTTEHPSSVGMSARLGSFEHGTVIFAATGLGVGLRPVTNGIDGAKRVYADWGSPSWSPSFC